jgi:RHS repeat-associated protein
MNTPYFWQKAGALIIGLALLPKACLAEFNVVVLNAGSCSVGPFSGYTFTYQTTDGMGNYSGGAQYFVSGAIPPGGSATQNFTTTYGSTVDAASAGHFTTLPGGAACAFSGDTIFITINGGCYQVNDKCDFDDYNNCPCQCGGMPVWSVSEPYISLWLHDEPLGYQPSAGNRLSFKLSYDQREVQSGYNTNMFGLGKKWRFSWLSYITQDANTNRTVYFPNGGQSTFFYPSDSLDYNTRTALTGDTNSGFTLTYPDGKQDFYGFIVTNSSGAFQEALLSKSINPVGQTTTLYYASYDPASIVVRLSSVVDGDGRTNLIYYNPANAYSTNLISQVVDAFNRTANLYYSANGDLTNITDVAGNSTAINYDGNDWVTNLVTPYGTTSFVLTDTSGTNVSPNGRSVLVNQPDGGHQLFLYQDAAPGIADSYPSGQIPQTTGLNNTLDTSDLKLRNSFHWGLRQYAALSTTNVTLFTANDFQKAHMNHWLGTTPQTPGNSLSIEREPSPDSAGTIPGQMIWYDYVNKTSSENQGGLDVPQLIARVLPDGTTAFSHMDRNYVGVVLTNINTYTSGGGIALRTNLFTCAANHIDVLTATNALGVLTSSNVFNGNHQVLTNIDALGEKTVYIYNASNQVSSITRPNGLVTTNIFNPDNSLAQQIVIGFSTNTFTYTNDLVLTHTDPRGLNITNFWDNLNRLTGMLYPDGSSISNIFTFLDLTATRDRLGNWTYFAYDSMRRNTAITNALGNATYFNYCTCGSLASTIDADGNVTYYNYDNQGNRTNTVYADGYSTTTTYNLLRQAVILADSSGAAITNFYDNQGMLAGSVNAAGVLLTNLYDVLDRVTNSTDANGVIVGSTYDNLNRILTRAFPGGAIELFGYTTNYSSLTSYTNQIGNITRYGYDSLNRKTNEVVVGVTTNGFTYDGASDLLALTDGKAQVTQWGYDTFGRVTNKVDALATNIFSYQYDADNRLTNRWTPAKGTTVYQYDLVGNLTNVDYSGGTSPIYLRYDAMNRLTNMVDGIGTTAYSYDAVGQMLSEGGLWPDDTVSYTYNNRLRTGLSIAAPNASAWTQSYGYDSARRLKNVVSPAGEFDYAYDPMELQRVDQLRLPNGAVVTNKYDNVARLTLTELMNSHGTNLDSYAYGYNPANQRTNVTRTAGDTVNYTYDNEGELVTAKGFESGGSTARLQEQFGYAYDAAGNVNWRTNNTLVQQFNVNNLNELTTVTNGGRLTVAGTTTSVATNVTVNTSSALLYADVAFASTNQSWVNGNNTYTAIAKDVYGRQDTNSITVNLQATNLFAYDLNGNMLTNGSEVLVWNDENELVTNFVAASWKSEFVYDGKLRRRIERDYTWSAGTSGWVQTNEIHFIYDGNVPIQHRDGNNLPTLTLTRGNDLSGSLQSAGGIGGILAMTENSLLLIGDPTAHSYFHADGNGNVTMLINNNQTQVGKALYDPFGNFLSLSGSKSHINSCWFSSKAIHWQSGKYDFLYRWLATPLDTWLNRDPLGEKGGVDLYCFVENNPVSKFDKFGLAVVSWPNFPPLPNPTEPVEPPSPMPGPVFNPGFWDQPQICKGNNCYNYALDRPYDMNSRDSINHLDDAFKQPPGPANDCPSLVAGVIAQGAQKTDKCGKCPAGSHAIRLWVRPDGGDFHFYRQDADGSWSSKRGNRPIERVIDPNIYRGYKNCGDLCAPNLSSTY